MPVLTLLATQPLALLSLLVAIVTAVTIHEFAHAWAADQLGDPTPRLQDRVTLNPLAHLDPLGSLVFLLTLRFGWGKPVVFDPYNLAQPRRDTLLIAAAGPLSNVLLAVILTLLPPNPFSPFLWHAIGINIALAVFNLIPIHPLDGGKILAGLLPHRWAHEFDSTLHEYGFIIVALLIFPLVNGQSAVSLIVGPVLDLIMNLLAVIHGAVW